MIVLYDILISRARSGISQPTGGTTVKIVIVGSRGVVGSTFCEFFEGQGHEVIGIDRDNLCDLEAAAKEADVVYVVVLPIEETGEILAKAVEVMQPGSLLMHGASVENPTIRGYFQPIQPELALVKGIAYAHLHPHFRPKNLEESFRGHAVTVHLEGDPDGIWKEWISETFQPFHPSIYWLEEGQHDQLTSISQLIHMVVAVLVGLVWWETPESVVRDGLKIGGLPCQLLARMVLRVAAAPEVIAGILCTHPLVREILNKLEKALALIRQASDGSPSMLIRALNNARRIFEPGDLSRYDEMSARLDRLEADLRNTEYTLRFSVEENVPFLLARAVHEFGIHGADLTTTIAQRDPDGGCTFIFGVCEKNAGTEAAAEAVRNRSWSE